MTHLEGKAVVITGSGGGIGAAYAFHLANRGVRVVVNDISQHLIDEQVARITDAGGNAVGFLADVANSDEAEALIDECVTHFGSIDGLVNNAAITFVAPPTKLDADFNKKLMEINVLGSINCGVYAMRHMLSQGHGSIVNVTSGAHMGLTNTAVYGASKGAIAALTYDWAADLAGTGVRVNAVSPMAGTDMITEALKARELVGDQLEQELATFPTPEANAPVVSYLISDRSNHLNGQIVRIDGSNLSIVSRPAILQPVMTSPEWTDESVADAFDQTLSAMAMPTGILQLEGEYRFAAVSDYRIKFDD